MGLITLHWVMMIFFLSPHSTDSPSTLHCSPSGPASATTQKPPVLCGPLVPPFIRSPCRSALKQLLVPPLDDDVAPSQICATSSPLHCVPLQQKQSVLYAMACRTLFPSAPTTVSTLFSQAWLEFSLFNEILCLTHSLFFSVQFDGAEWERSSSPTERLRPPRSSPLAGGSRKFRMPCPDPHNMMGERVDPTLPLEKQVYVPHSFLL